MAEELTYDVLRAQMDAAEMWDSLSYAERRDMILARVPWQEWLNDDYLPTLALFRQDAIWWARIEERYKQLGGNGYRLGQAAEVLSPPKKLPQSSRNGTAYAPELDMTAEGLAIRQPDLTPSLSRPYGLSDAEHHAADIRVIEACIAEQWQNDGLIVACLIDAHISGRHTTYDLDTLQTLVGTVYLRLQGMDDAEDDGLTQRAHRIGKAKALQWLSTYWKIPVAQVIRHGTDENTLWHLKLLDGREIALGNDLDNPKKIAHAIFTVTGKRIPRVSAKELTKWDETMELLYEISDVVDTEELSRKGTIRAFLLSYADREMCRLDREADAEEWEKLAKGGKPFVRHARMHIHARTFWLEHVKGVSPEVKYADVLDWLRLLGGVCNKVTLNTVNTSRALWSVPVENIDEQVGKQVDQVMER